MMLAAWTHGCLGLHLALRARTAYRRHFHLLFAAAVLLPVLAALGFFAMGRELQWTGTQPAQMPTAAQKAALDATEQNVKWFYALALLALLAARRLRAWYERQPREASIELRYPDRTVRVPRGWSVLEASRAHDIAHCRCAADARAAPPAACACSGRPRMRRNRITTSAARWSGCVRRPTSGWHASCARAATSPSRRCLRRAPPPSPDAWAGSTTSPSSSSISRRWSGLSERQWPFDLVYVLDRYFAIVGAAVRETGGVPNQFIGDSVMAIFGLDVDLPTACRQAVRAADLIGERMDAWSAGFESQFGQHLDFGMGLHAGRAAVGEVGYLETTTFTAVGEVVNTASRLQDHSKAAATRLVISVFAAEQAGIADTLGEPEMMTVRGRSEALAVLHVPRPAH